MTAVLYIILYKLLQATCTRVDMDYIKANMTPFAVLKCIDTTEGWG